jgi:hypothetical protein
MNVQELASPNAMQGRDAAAGTFGFGQGVAHKILLMRNNSARMIWVIVAYALLVNLRHQQTFIPLWIKCALLFR